jgi:hypothetical protein
MSTRHITGCTGKKSFQTFTQAAKAAKRLNLRDRGHTEAYHCLHCNDFHIGEARSYRRRDERRG